MYIDLILLIVFRDLDKVDDLMQDITEQQELAQEISDAISRPVGFGDDCDEVSRDEGSKIVWCFIHWGAFKNLIPL